MEKTFCKKLEVSSYDNTTLHLIWEFFICKNFRTNWAIYIRYSLWLCVR